MWLAGKRLYNDFYGFINFRDSNDGSKVILWGGWGSPL